MLAASGGSLHRHAAAAAPGPARVTGGTGTAQIQYGAASLASDVAAGWTIRIEDRGTDTPA